jgi:hypothetical protein
MSAQTLNLIDDRHSKRSAATSRTRRYHDIVADASCRRLLIAAAPIVRLNSYREIGQGLIVSAAELLKLPVQVDRTGVVDWHQV